MSALGYAFQGKNPGGIGAALHAMMLCESTARLHSQPFGIVKDKLEWGLLNGYDSNCPNPKNWLSYFQGPKTLSRFEIESVWVNCRGFYYEAPDWYTGTQFEWYSEIMRELFQLRPEIQAEVEERVQKSGFLPSDAIVHIRRTDKILESPDIPLEKYLEVCQQCVPKGTRVFVCSDLIDIQVQFQKMLLEAGYPSTRDESEKESVQATRLAEGGPYLESWEENLNAFKILMIFSKASYLIGARASYLFRCGELLNLNIVSDPSRVYSIKDNLKLGSAPYVNRDARSFSNSSPYSISFNTEVESIKDENITVYPQFLPEGSRNELLKSMNTFQKGWLSNPSWAKTMHRTSRDPKHVKGCVCFACRMLVTVFQSKIWSSLLSQTDGSVLTPFRSDESVLTPFRSDESVLTTIQEARLDPTCIAYFEGDSHPRIFIRGMRMILFCSANWKEENGGVLSIWKKGKIVKTIVPQFGTLVLLHNVEFSISEVTCSTPDFTSTNVTLQSNISY